MIVEVLSDSTWSRTDHGPGSVIELDVIGVSFAVDEVYRGVL